MLSFEVTGIGIRIVVPEPAIVPETRRPLPDWQAIARHFFSPAENRELMALPESQRRRGSIVAGPGKRPSSKRRERGSRRFPGLSMFLSFRASLLRFSPTTTNPHRLLAGSSNTWMSRTSSLPPSRCVVRRMSLSRGTAGYEFSDPPRLVGEERVVTKAHQLRRRHDEQASFAVGMQTAEAPMRRVGRSVPVPGVVGWKWQSDMRQRVDPEWPLERQRLIG